MADPLLRCDDRRCPGWEGPCLCRHPIPLPDLASTLTTWRVQTAIVICYHRCLRCDLRDLTVLWQHWCPSELSRCTLSNAHLQPGEDHRSKAAPCACVLLSLFKYAQCGLLHVRWTVLECDHTEKQHCPAAALGGHTCGSNLPFHKRHIHRESGLPDKAMVFPSQIRPRHV